MSVGSAAALSLSGETAIVTGAGRGIGRAIARAFAGAGATVFLVARTAKDVERTAHEITRAGGRAVAHPADVTLKADMEALVRRALDTTGRIDILVNNAGVFLMKTLAKLQEDEWDRVLGTNLKAAYLLIHAALPALMKAPRGRILNVSSIHGTVGDANVVAHCAAKFGLVGLTKALASELRGVGIAVNAICPGSTDSRGREEALRPHEAPLKEKLSPEDVAGAALFLASPASAPITGAVLDVWGGTHLAIRG
ncbi:MAG TPA: SDR family NAD(P)-dependent oxidoreductase [Thermoanaerobaculia bacterium]|nr:SDR family NAD(P)-dependent oxidoreductase [Thermoanaerobaculia bacterium]